MADEIVIDIGDPETNLNEEYVEVIRGGNDPEEEDDEGFTD